MGYIANVFIFIGYILMGRKDKNGFIASFIGNGIYLGLAIQRRELDWFILCFAFSIIATYNYIKWYNEEVKIRNQQNLYKSYTLPQILGEYK